MGRRLIDGDELIEQLLADAITDEQREFAEKVRYAAERMKPVDAVPVVPGRWNCSDDMYESAVCSCCGWDTAEPWVHIKEWFEFCPHCGAKMDGD